MVKKFSVLFLVFVASLSVFAASSRGVFISASRSSSLGCFQFFSTTSLVEKNETDLYLGCNIGHGVTVYGNVSADLSSHVTSFNRFAGPSRIAGLGAGAGVMYGGSLFSIRSDARLVVFFPEGDYTNLYSMLAVRICPAAVVFDKQTGRGRLCLSAGLPLGFRIGGCGRSYDAGLCLSVVYMGGLAE